jgi:antitoxin component of MazEF toxin-antitoxin module
MFMATVVKVRKWGNSLGVRLPKNFAMQHEIADGTPIDIEQIRVVQVKPRRRSSFRLKDILKSYVKPPKSFDFPPAGKEIL